MMTETPVQHNKIERPHREYRQWLLMQAQLQQDYASNEKAVSLINLVESVYGADLETGLMLCRAWADLGELTLLEQRVERLLADNQLNCEQRAAIYYCLSFSRYQADDLIGARRAHQLYLSLASNINQESDEKPSA